MPRRNRPLLGDRCGWRPLPASISAAEFELVINHVSPQERSLLLWREDAGPGTDGWYRKDDDAVPAVYRLQPRTGEYTQDACWAPVEAHLRQILLHAQVLIPLGERDRLKYTGSATHQEIVAGILAHSSASDYAFCLSRSITDLETHLIPKLSSQPDAVRYVDLTDQGSWDCESHQRLIDLKQDLQRRLGDHFAEFTCQWQNDR